VPCAGRGSENAERFWSGGAASGRGPWPAAHRRACGPETCWTKPQSRRGAVGIASSRGSGKVSAATPPWVQGALGEAMRRRPRSARDAAAPCAQCASQRAQLFDGGDALGRRQLGPEFPIGRAFLVERCAPPDPDLRHALIIGQAARGVKALVVGGYAFAFRAKPRFTKDIDIFVEPTEANAASLLQALDDFGFGGLGLTMADFTTPGTAQPELAGLPSPDPAAIGVEAATQAYLDTVPPEKRARSDAYFEGGYWLILWRFVWSSLALLVLLHFRPVRAPARSRRAAHPCRVSPAGHLLGGVCAVHVRVRAAARRLRRLRARAPVRPLDPDLRRVVHGRPEGARARPGDWCRWHRGVLRRAATGGPALVDLGRGHCAGLRWCSWR
jgi:hypothetical protein